MFTFDKLELPRLGLRGLEAGLTEEEQAIQDATHRFAEEVMRPIGKKLDSMTPEELAQYGIDIAGVRGEAELEHVLHHLSPTFSPTKKASPNGIRPLGTEVHGYVIPGFGDVIEFFPLSTGRFKAEDVLNPEITGEVVVFAPEAAG